MLDRALGGPTHMMQSGISQARELNDPPELPGKTEFLLREWVNMYHSPAAGRDSTKAFTAFVQQVYVYMFLMQKFGLLHLVSKHLNMEF